MCTVLREHPLQAAVPCLSPSEAYAAGIRALISDDQTFDIPHYHAHFDPPPSDDGTTHISVLGPDGQAVSVTS